MFRLVLSGIAPWSVFTLAQHFNDECEVEEAEEEHVEFLEAGKDAAEALEPAEESLYLIALLVEGRSYSQGVIQFDFGGTTGIMPRESTSCLVSSPSQALSISIGRPSGIVSRSRSKSRPSGVSCALPGDKAKVMDVRASAATI